MAPCGGRIRGAAGVPGHGPAVSRRRPLDRHRRPGGAGGHRDPRSIGGPRRLRRREPTGRRPSLGDHSRWSRARFLSTSESIASGPPGRDVGDGRNLEWVPGGPTARRTGHRRRQPLLRGARRASPPPRPAWADRTVRWCDIDGAKFHVVGGRVSRAVTNATPVVRAGDARLLPGQPDGRDPLSFLTDREPIRPEYRDRDARVAALDEGPGRVLDVPDARNDLRGAAHRRPRGMLRHVPGVQPLGAGTTGLRSPRPHLRRSVHHPGRSGLGRRRAAVGARRRRQLIVMRPAARPRCPVGSRRSTRGSLRFWGCSTSRGFRWSCTPATAGSAQRLRPDGFSASFSGWVHPVDPSSSPRTGHQDFLLSMLLENHLVRYPNLRIVSVENRPSSCPTCSCALDGPQGRRVVSPTTPSTCSGPRCGSTRSGRTTSCRSSSRMRPDRVVFGSDWPHIEGCARSTTSPRSRICLAGPAARAARQRRTLPRHP